MEKEKFTHNLIKIAFCSMACDSDIDKSEITKINEIVEKDFYFDGHSLSKDIDLLKKELDETGPIFIEKILNEQLFLNYSESQKIIIIEVSIGVIKADKKLEITEIDFINQLISNLKIPSDIIKARFGNWDSLNDDSYNLNSLDIS
jgi:uncharacterized tellurite resistance protein B-like protein|tara:strand:+ start:359 stop:796 length:438 start_codon:yes stop_codon:yes gene_type:complete